MSLLSFLFPPKPVSTGYVADDKGWLERLPEHDIFAAGGPAPSWWDLRPEFRSQEGTMMCTAFASCNAAYMLNRLERLTLHFSPLELFTRSGGAVFGNYMQATEAAMKEALVPEEECPWVGPVSEWGPYILRLMGEYAKAKTGEKNKWKKYAIKNLTRVMPDRESMRRALASSPLILIVNVGRGYFDDPAPRVSSGYAHAICALEVKDDGSIVVLDSLQNRAGFDGIHRLGPDFEVLYAFGMLDLPNDWQDKQAEAKKPITYNKVFDARALAKALITLDAARKANPTHAPWIDRNREIYGFAIAFGGFSIQDLLNDISSQRRGKGAIFDLSFPRP